MSENSERLKLIERAAKRLMNHPMAASPTSDPQPPDILIKNSVDTRRDSQRIEPHFEGGRAFSAAEVNKPTARRARLNFSQLRRLGVTTPDNVGSAISYDCRAIKRKLLATARDSKTRVLTNNLLMVTSALAGEGKTFTAMNLALTLAAERDLHVLLIDGDVVKPSLNALFEHEGDAGLTDLLTGKCPDVADVLYRCEDFLNLSVMFAGTRDKNAPELLSSQRMAAICNELSKRYDDRIVIIDTPPVLACAEPANIAQHVHQVLLVVAASHATRSQIRAALENVSTSPSVSIVLNKVPNWYKVSGEPYYYYGNQDVAAQ